MAETKTISVILVTYNSEAVIKPCLDAIFSQDLKDYEVIVIDNASKDQTTSILKSQYKNNIILIKNANNYGFSKAINQGIAKSSAKFILSLNDDCILKADFLKNALCAIESNPRIAAIQPKVLRSDGRHIDTKGILLSSFRKFYDIGKGAEDNEQFNMPGYIFGACAVAALYRKEALETIKQADEYFDEDFFCLAEDVDMGWRLKKMRWLTLYSPNAVCWHIGGISRDNNKITQYYSMRNRYLMMLKNESLAGLLRFTLVFLIYDLWRNLYMLFVNPGYFLKATYETIILTPKMIQKRRLTYGN